MREYERTSTTVVNAYVGPVVRTYLEKLVQRLEAAGFDGNVLMMQSSGGLLDVAQVQERPATVVESGPAAGVVGAARLGMAAGYKDIITFDMGGTTAKASLIQDGCVTATDDYEVGGGISMSSALAKGGGYALRLPIIDVSEVGAGGGSIVRIDAGGVLKIGPESVGAVPGPACYDRGGEHATVTDANVVLGYLNPVALAGGTVPVKAIRAQEAITRTVCDPTGIDLLEAAYGIHRVANATMMRAVKAVSTYRGRNPRDFTLLAFGGNGGMHAAALARELNIGRVIVPPGAGVFSAVGLLVADYEMGRSLSLSLLLKDGETELLEKAFSDLETSVLEGMTYETTPTLTRSVQLRYKGQGSELGVVVPPGVIVDETLNLLSAGFETEHKRSYGYINETGLIELVSLRVVASLPPARAPRVSGIAGLVDTGEIVTRKAYFGSSSGLMETPVITRMALSDTPRSGPMIIEEYEGTTIVPPDCTAWRDSHNNIVIQLGAEEQQDG